MRTSAAIGTVELTGFEMIPINALGQDWAQALIKSLTIDALVLNKSSRVMPGLRGTPAGMMTTSTPTNKQFFYIVILEYIRFNKTFDLLTN